MVESARFRRHMCPAVIIGLFVLPAKLNALLSARVAIRLIPRATVCALARGQKLPPPPPPDSFQDLGCSSSILEALEAECIHAPMEAQYLAFDVLRHSQTDVALVAEAGSGKTLAYLVPLLDQLLQLRTAGRNRSRMLYVVVPTHDLASQVLRVARRIAALTPLTIADAESAQHMSKSAMADAASGSKAKGTESGKALGAEGSRGSGRGEPATDQVGDGGSGRVGKRVDGSSPDVIIGTANACAAMITSAVKRISGRPAVTIVFDECDVLLAGVRATGSKAAASPAGAILDAVRKGAKRGPSAAGKASEGGVTPQEASADWHLRDLSELEVPDAPAGMGGSIGRDGAGGEPAAPRVVFVSATVPGQGASSLGSYLDGRFPGIKWVRTVGAHRPLPKLRCEFMDVGESSDERAAVLLSLCREAQGSKTLVFASSAARAEDAWRVLDVAGLKPRLFHPDVPLGTREQTLAAFAMEPHGVLVCSGLAARGIDLPEVALVIEYQMAPNLVEYMHRVGRTARAGREGRAISLVRPTSKNEAALVSQIQRSVAGGWKFF